MAKKNGMYANSYGDKSDRRGEYMIREDMSEPSNMPRRNKSVYYADVDCGGVMVNDSVRASDKQSSEMARKLKSQLVKEDIF